MKIRDSSRHGVPLYACPKFAGRKSWLSVFFGSRSTFTGPHLVLSSFPVKFSRWSVTHSRVKRWPLCWYPGRSSHFSPILSLVCSAIRRGDDWQPGGGGARIFLLVRS